LETRRDSRCAGNPVRRESAVSRRKEALVGAGERGKLGISRRARRGKIDHPGGREKNAYFLEESGERIATRIEDLQESGISQDGISLLWWWSDPGWAKKRRRWDVKLL